MGKHFPAYRNDDQSEGLFPGCMWGIFYALDYHHWQNNVKRLVPHKRHNKQKSAKSKKNPKATLGVNGSVPKLMNGESSDFLVNQHTNKTSSTHKRTLKARIKALVAEKLRKEDDKKISGSNFPALLQLERTLSVKHIESLNDGFSKAGNEWKSPIIFFPRKATPGATKLQHPARMKANDWQKFDMCTKENLMDYVEQQKIIQNYTLSGARETSVNQARANQLMQNGSSRQHKKYVDVLELFQVNEDLFQEFQHKADAEKEDCSHVPDDFSTKARLTKSGTFPSANLSYSRRRNFKPAKLKDKQTEVWSSPRGVKLRKGPQEPEVDCVVAADLKNERQRLESQNKADRNELTCTSNLPLDQISIGDEPSTGCEQINKFYDADTANDDCRDLNRCNVNDGSLCNQRSNNSMLKRSSSLNDSLHRYARLYDYSFGKKSKLDVSQSTGLRHEYDISETESAPISFIRIRSLPHGDSSWTLEDEESRETLYPNVPNMTAMVGTTATEDNILKQSKPVCLPRTENFNNCLPSDVKEENLVSETIAENIECSTEIEYMESLTMGVSNCGTHIVDEYTEELDEQSKFFEDLQVTFVENDKNAPETSPAVSMLGSSFQKEVANTANIASEGLEYTSQLTWHNSSITDVLPQARVISTTSHEKEVENPTMNFKKHIHTKSHKDDDADLAYVREILKVAGFNENGGFHGEWYSSELPLSPLIFDEVEESWWPHESECSQENLILLYHHQLLFDLINEVILQIYETSFTYYPRALSTACQVHPLRSSSHVKEVLQTLDKYNIGNKPEVLVVDDPVPQDLAKADGWMNLQVESECVALELDDLIFDQLLEELICC